MKLIYKLLIITMFLLCSNGCSMWQGLKKDVTGMVGKNKTKCPFCGTYISKNAVVCYNCKRDLPDY